MIIDTSALIAILLEEPDALAISHAMRPASAAGDLFIAVPTLLECHIVIFGRKRERGIVELELLLKKSTIAVQPFQSSHLKIAREAYNRYGKASGHQAKLNFGDCFSYALAKHRNDVLLCKGDDFARTDIKLVNY